MKTLTEFNFSTLKNVLEKRQELTTAGKTAEELPAALGEALKLEGDKLTLVMSALETVETKLNGLKRVVVLTLAEGEKAPAAALQKGEHYFVIEHYPPLPGEQRGKRGAPGDREGGRDGKGRGGRDGKGRGGKGGRDGGRGGRDAGRGGQDARGPGRSGRPTPNANIVQTGVVTPASGEAGSTSGGRPPRNRAPRQPRPEGAPQKQLAPGERLPLPKPLHPDKLPPRKEHEVKAQPAEQAAPSETSSTSESTSS